MGTVDLAENKRFYNNKEGGYMLNVILIGLGKQSTEDHLPAIINSSKHKLLAVCDTNAEILNKISKEYNVPGFLTVDDLLKNIKADLAILALPHNAYYPVIKKLAQHKINIIKEKPFATSINEALKIHNVIMKNKVFLGITLQRRFNPIFQEFLKFKDKVGKIYSIEGRYTMNIKNLGDGWRASKKIAKGGALIDMGYHFIDLLVWYMGMPQTITAKLSRGNRLKQLYDVEDTATLLFDYTSKKAEEKTIGNFIISRAYPKKEEKISFYGTDGIIDLHKEHITLLDINGIEIETFSKTEKASSILSSQLDFFSKIITGESKERYSYVDQFKHVSIIEAAYKSDSMRNSYDPSLFMQKISNI